MDFFQERGWDHKCSGSMEEFPWQFGSEALVTFRQVGHISVFSFLVPAPFPATPLAFFLPPQPSGPAFSTLSRKARGPRRAWHVLTPLRPHPQHQRAEGKGRVQPPETSRVGSETFSSWSLESGHCPSLQSYHGCFFFLTLHQFIFVGSFRRCLTHVIAFDHHLP